MWVSSASHVRYARAEPRRCCAEEIGLTATDKKPADERLNDLAIDHASRDFARVLSHATVARALEDIQESQVQSRIVYIYVVDADGKLQGVVPTRRILLSPPGTPIADIMVRNVVRISSEATLLDACEMFILHRLLALPIVDREGRIQGVIDVDEYTDEIQQLDAKEQSDEIFQLIGVHVTDVRKATVPSLFANRFPWLLCNIAGGLACAVIAGLFQTVLDQVVLLALFIPVVLALAESVSIQSLTLILQRQHGRAASWRAIGENLAAEVPVGLMLGLACGVCVGGFAWFWKGSADTALTILVSIALSVALAATFGLMVPLLLHKMQRDPKVAAGPMTLALTDMATLTFYLGFGTWALL